LKKLSNLIQKELNRINPSSKEQGIKAKS
jgi:hypothetical protein